MKRGRGGVQRTRVMAHGGAELAAVVNGGAARAARLAADDGRASLACIRALVMAMAWRSIAALVSSAGLLRAGACVCAAQQHAILLQQTRAPTTRIF